MLTFALIVCRDCAGVVCNGYISLSVLCQGDHLQRGSRKVDYDITIGDSVCVTVSLTIKSSADLPLTNLTSTSMILYVTMTHFLSGYATNLSINFVLNVFVLRTYNYSLVITFQP